MERKRDSDTSFEAAVKAIVGVLDMMDTESAHWLMTELVANADDERLNAEQVEARIEIEQIAAQLSPQQAQSSKLFAMKHIDQKLNYEVYEAKQSRLH